LKSKTTAHGNGKRSTNRREKSESTGLGAGGRFDTAPTLSGPPLFAKSRSGCSRRTRGTHTRPTVSPLKTPSSAEPKDFMQTRCLTFLRRPPEPLGAPLTLRGSAHINRKLTRENHSPLIFHTSHRAVTQISSLRIIRLDSILS
jgi:hypothetical protein